MSYKIDQLNAKRKSGMFAAGLNFVLPGAGYIYCGRILLGLVALCFTIVMVYANPFALITMLIVLVIDGFLSADRYNKQLDAKIQKSMKKCPQCAETVLPEAKLCKHCGSKFN
jgi:hypothetical protein